MDAPVHFAFTVIRRRVVEPVAPDHKSLENVAEWAFALADAYNKVIAVSWPYWNLSFPNEMTDGTAGSGAMLVCGEHELLCVINDRVRQLQRANEMLGGLMTRLRCDPPVSCDETSPRANMTCDTYPREISEQRGRYDDQPTTQGSDARSEQFVRFGRIARSPKGDWRCARIGGASKAACDRF